DPVKEQAEALDKLLAESSDSRDAVIRSVENINPSCREASEGSAPVWVRTAVEGPCSADALSKYENSGAHGIDPPPGAPSVSSGWDARLIM
ncbi:hypothetical protein, partial [Streptomyces sp. NPDC006307]|uniref:hypothetical protein n=1 Tax=Streptomyces sp. NPDC006307 TaxID=3156748 RepID=UPI0033AA4312